MRLIDADKLLKSPFRITGKFRGKYPFEAITVSMINSCPTIDPVHAAGACYCGECGYCIHQPGLKSVKWICIEWHNYCDCGPKIVAPNDFCNYGKRKEEQP